MSYAPPLPAAVQARVALPFAICTLIWGSTWFVIGSQLQYVPAAWCIAYRFTLACIAMVAVAKIGGRSLAIGRAGHGLAIMVGVPQFTFNYIFVYSAEEQIASGLVALVSALLIVPNALLGRALLGQAVSRRFLIGSGVAMAGIALLFADGVMRGGGLDAHRTILGVVLSLGGVVAASTANVLQGTRQAKAIPPASLIAWAMAYGAACDIAYALVTAGPPVFSTAPIYLAGLLYLAVAGSAVTFTLYFALIRTIGPARAGYIGVLIPVIAMALSTLFEGYRWTAAAAAGAALAVAGLLVAMRARSPTR
ncbi:DMT family transporter [Sphingomonas nostoxanthinifaciens]|uniref:DMT family transporter n=1 Tax=Sphingomonas nostoxanthinifaciens TaxID=2872652 RepID=UPI001CC20F53|nr:EamA family transporter [Sphingomonas nostoxanthinifaciens]UAK24825.1 EamA family transporter [Sphingomonas nostoxanthinifaciens]